MLLHYFFLQASQTVSFYNKIITIRYSGNTIITIQMFSIILYVFDYLHY